MRDMMHMITEIEITGILTMKMLIEEIISKFQRIQKVIGTLKITMNIVIIEVEGVVAKRNLEEVKVLAKNLIDVGRVNLRKMDSRISTLDLVPPTTGTGEGGEEEEMVEIIQGEIPGCLPQIDHNGGKTPETVPLKAAGETPDVTLLQVLITVGPTHQYDTLEYSGGTLRHPVGAGVPSAGRPPLHTVSGRDLEGEVVGVEVTLLGDKLRTRGTLGTWMAGQDRITSTDRTQGEWKSDSGTGSH